MKQLLNKMLEQKSLSREEARSALLDIADGRCNEALLSAFMTIFLMRSITIDELQGFRDALLERRLDVDFQGADAIDIVGTGGDGKNTFNISTCASFVVAGAGGKVIKHGNYGASSVSGASNVLEYFGVGFNSDADALHRSFDESGVAFLHAPLFNSAMKAVAPVRKALGLRTFFNILGPLVNPARPCKQLLGVYNLKLMRLYRYFAERTGMDSTIVFSLDGYDEISLTSPFKVSEAGSESVLTPADIGMPTVVPEELFGGDTIAEAARIFISVLKGESTHPRKNCVVANAAFALKTLNPGIDIKDAISMASESIDSGAALNAFNRFIEVNKKK